MQIDGILVDREGNPVKFQGLQVMNFNEEEEKVSYSFTDPKGFFSLINLAENSEYEIRILGLDEEFYRFRTGLSRDVVIGTLYPEIDPKEERAL